MPQGMNTDVTRSLYLLFTDRLIFLQRLGTPEQVAEAISVMGAGCHFDDYKTDGALVGGIRFMDWIIDHVQYGRGMTELDKPRRKATKRG